MVGAGRGREGSGTSMRSPLRPVHRDRRCTSLRTQRTASREARDDFAIVYAVPFETYIYYLRIKFSGTRKLTSTLVRIRVTRHSMPHLSAVTYYTVRVYRTHGTALSNERAHTRAFYVYLHVPCSGEKIRSHPPPTSHYPPVFVCR